MEERLGRIYALERRYGDTEAEVIAHGERASAELERLASLDDERGRRQREDAALLAEVAETAGELSASRRSAADALTTAVGGLLVELGFRPACSRSRSAGGRRARMSPRSSSMAMPSRSTPPVRPGRLPPRTEPRRTGATAGADRVGR
jgi:hypothetical protein